VHRYVLHNREIRDSRDKLLSPGQVGFLNGWGVFTTLRVTSGVLFAFERHYARMRHDAKLLRIPFALSEEELLRALLSLVEANSASDAVLRMAIVRNRGGLFEAPGMESECDLVAFTASLTKWGASAHLTYVPNARFGASPFAGCKITSWAQNLTWYEQAHEAGFDEALLLNEDGQISECTSANIFAIQGKEVWTPPLSTSGCLPGVTRAILLEEVQLDGIEITERELSPSELEASDAVFLTSTTRDLLPVHAIDGASLPVQNVILERLQKTFCERRNAYTSDRYLVRS